MAKKNVRNMKVCGQSGYKYETVPAITLKGKWLEELGFHLGDYAAKIAGLTEVPAIVKTDLSDEDAYFAKKFTDFAGLHMAFFATVLLSFLFIQDTRKSTYELLHTKPVTAIQYICGKVISGFISMLGVLVILNVIFFMLCLKTSLESGFPVTPIDFCVNSLIYIVPNLLMICCVYTITAVIFKNPLPAAPILFLHIIYSNMLTMKNDIYYMRPFSIMVRFPGRFFETHVAKMSNINQIILVISSVILVCISVTIWKRRRVH